MPNQRIAVIGGVASGPAAAAQAKRTDPHAEVVLYEQGPHISYGACEMPYYVADQIADAAQLVVLTPDRFEQTRGAQVQVRHRVLGLHPRRNRLEVKDEVTGTVTEERFDKFILAVGAQARLPDCDGLEAPNLFALRRLEDAIAIKDYLTTHTVHHAVILGGGYIGVELAEALRERGVRASILEPSGGLLGSALDEALRPLVHETVERHGVLIRQDRARAFEREAGGAIRSVVTERGEKIGCQLVLAAMGIVPNVAVGQAAGVAVGATGAFAVDAHMRTNLPNVWACGDCVEVERVVDGKNVYLPLSTVAFRTARVAAENAARRGRGKPARFRGVCGTAAVKVFDLEVASVGLRLEEAQQAGFDAFATQIKHWSRVRIYPGARPLHVRLVVAHGSGRLLGAELVGEDGAALRANVLVPCIHDRWTVDQVKDLDLLYTPPFAPAHDPLLIAANEASKRVKRGV